MSIIVPPVMTDQRLVALTFDDGPHAKYTPLILDVLDEESALATFFIRGSALSAETREIVQRIDGAGHDVGNHTHQHLRSLAGVDASLIHEEIARTHHELEEVVGRAPTLLRPPYGGGPMEVNAAAERYGYRATVLWTAWAHDWDNPQVPADIMVKRVQQGYNGCPGIAAGGIVLMHDGCAPEQAEASRAETVETVRQLVPALRAEGFRLVTVSELLDAAGVS